jgi:hypothetical protein
MTDNYVPNDLAQGGGSTLYSAELGHESRRVISTIAQPRCLSAEGFRFTLGVADAARICSSCSLRRRARVQRRGRQRAGTNGGQPRAGHCARLLRHHRRSRSPWLARARCPPERAGGAEAATLLLSDGRPGHILRRDIARSGCRAVFDAGAERTSAEAPARGVQSFFRLMRMTPPEASAP